MKKETILDRVKNVGKNQEAEIFKPRFSWKLRFWSWMLSRRIRIATNSYKNDRTKFGHCIAD